MSVHFFLNEAPELSDVPARSQRTSHPRNNPQSPVIPAAAWRLRVRHFHKGQPMQFEYLWLNGAPVPDPDCRSAPLRNDIPLPHPTPPTHSILSPGLSRLSWLPHSWGSPFALLPHNLCNLPAFSPRWRFPLFLFHFIPFNLCLIFTQGRGFTPELHLLSLYSSLFFLWCPHPPLLLSLSL